MNPNHPNPDYPIKNYCAAVAFLINSDNLACKFTEQKFDAKSVFESNSHGELFGVIQACEFVSRAISMLQTPEKIKTALDEIVKGGTMESSADYASGLGMICMTFLYNMPQEFKDALWSKESGCKA